MDINIAEPLKTDWLQHRILPEQKLRLGLLRLDLLHPVISGNKWFKLKENLQLALARNATAVLTFGGAYSNHLVATAAAAKAFGLRSIGFVRGLHAAQDLTPTLVACQEYGMELKFLTRAEYQQKTEIVYLQKLAETFPATFFIPEGGHNAAGIAGAADIAQWIANNTSIVCVPVGSGTTLAGIAGSVREGMQVFGFCAMKHGAYLKNDLRKIINRNNWHLIDDAHRRGFAKHDSDLIHWMNWFYREFSIPLDFVYTAKMMKRVFDLLASGYFPKGSQLVCLHTGGLQGNSSIAQQLVFA